MFNGVLKNLLTSGGDDVVRNLATNYGDDVARSIGSKATNVLDDLLPATAKKTVVAYSYGQRTRFSGYS